jgi:hypothetical protein
MSEVVDHFPACGNGLLTYFPECQILTKEFSVGGSGDIYMSEGPAISLDHSFSSLAVISP